jgi:ElaB/YqjD/DUF883 family membrane-anchored ribosome-binding protein
MSEETPASGKPGDASEDERRARDDEHKARTMAQVQPIIEAAEQAATGILEEAEAQARKQIEQAEARAEDLASERAHDMWALTDELIARAEGVKRRADELLEALERTRRGVGSVIEAGPPSEPRPEEPPAPLKPPAPLTPGLSEPLSEGARLLATQMVVAGSSRAEIARRLQHDFGIEDPDSMLDAIHGLE